MCPSPSAAAPPTPSPSRGGDQRGSPVHAGSSLGGWGAQPQAGSLEKAGEGLHGTERALESQMSDVVYFLPREKMSLTAGLTEKVLLILERTQKSDLSRA